MGSGSIQLDPLGVLAVDVQTAGRMLGISTRTTWQFVSTGALGSCLIGRRRVVPVEAIRAFLADHASRTRKGVVR